MIEYVITPARARDVPLLGAIELAAARLLAGHAPEPALRETTPAAELLEAQRDGRLWVALAHDEPVGFAHVRALGPAIAHLEEIDVHPDHGRRGIGTRLVEAVCGWAGRVGYEWVTLTTFRDVPWNMPFYSRLGFDVISDDDRDSALQAIVDDEARRGLDRARRVAMRRAVIERRALVG